MFMSKKCLIVSLLICIALITACNPYPAQPINNGIEEKVNFGTEDESYPYTEGDDIPAVAYMEHGEIYNPESVIPPQCYTKTEGTNNPCYACHQSYDREQMRPNQMGDGTLQGNYEFSEVGLTNSWKNLFVDRTEMIKAISDESIAVWVDQDNYQSATTLPASMKLDDLAIPADAFDKRGLAKDGSFWVAYNYKPFPSTFWPTNGSFGDAMIRLPKAFREVNGQTSDAIYFLNLSLVEIAIKDIPAIDVFPFNEKRYQLDINQDGVFSTHETRLTKPSHYFGDAKDIKLERMLYPQESEFLHTVRYLGENENGEVSPSKRMKEVRYMKKHLFRNRQSLASAYYAEAKDKHFEQLPQTRYLGERGIDNGFGWTINGFIEDEKGELRPQHEQELAYCNGCHKSVGATFDQTFSFARKAPGASGWGYINLALLTDVPNISVSGAKEELGEYLTYMQRVGGGDEFRQNTEMLDKWFTSEGIVDAAKVQNSPSLQDLIVPSPERAKSLNKAYFTIVKEQSYLFGRDATVTKATNVLQSIDAEQPPLLEAHQFKWDMRLNWEAKPVINNHNIAQSMSSPHSNALQYPHLNQKKGE
jgi:hypothetical protein